MAQVPAKTLRYYDDIDLFEPDYVDPQTQYRYYSMSQLPRLYRILALKALGLTLNEIRDILDDDLSIEELRGMLRLKQAELQQTAQKLQQRIDFVKHKLYLLESDAPSYDVILKDIPPITLALARTTVPEKAVLGSKLSTLFRDVIAFLEQNDCTPSGAGMTLYFDDEYRETHIDVGAAFPIEVRVAPTEHILVERLPEHRVASVVHHGELSGLEDAYRALFTWIDANNYTIESAPREIALAYDPHGSEQDFVTELQLPIKES